MPDGRQNWSVLELAGSHGHQRTRRISSVKAAHAASSEPLELISADMSLGFTDTGWKRLLGMYGPPLRRKRNVGMSRVGPNPSATGLTSRVLSHAEQIRTN